MKKVIWTLMGLSALCYCAVCIASVYRSMPNQLVPLRHLFSAECEKAKWNANIGFLEAGDLDQRLGKIIKERNSLLKDLGVKSFNAEWICSTRDTEKSIYRKPEATFIGLYWR